MNLLKDVPEWVAKIAPTVATALGGPLAGMAVTALAQALGVPESEVMPALQSSTLTGEQIAKIKVAEIELKQKESDNGFKFAELDVRDRESARAMQVANKSNTPEILSWIIVLATLGLEGYVLLIGLPPGAPDLVIGRILGTLDAAFTTVLAFWLGSSVSNRIKDATIASQASKN